MQRAQKSSLVLAVMIMACCIFNGSCKKKEEKQETNNPPPINYDTDFSAASDINIAEWINSDAIIMGGQASESGSVSYKKGNNNIFSSCASVMVNTTTKISTVSFSGSTCNDGHVRSGTLTYDFSQSSVGATAYRHPGFKNILTSTNYVVDGNAVAITHTVTNTTPSGFNPASTNMTWSIASSITIIKPNNGGTITWSCSRTKTLMNTSAVTYAGNSISAAYVDQNTVIDWTKALISFGGNATGTTAKGESYSFSTTSPLVVNMNCTPDPNKPGRHPMVQGAFDFTPGSKGKRHVDFGNPDGACNFDCWITVYNTNGDPYGPIQVTLQ